MKINKPYTNKQRADLAVYCNKNGLVIEDKGEYLEAVNLPEPTQEEKETLIRGERTLKLRKTDWTVLPDSPLSDNMKSKYIEYRQALRDIPEQVGFPDTVKWPEEPT